MDPEQLLQQARSALARGWSREQVNQRLVEASGGEFSSLDSLEQAIGGASPEASPRPGLLDTVAGENATARESTAVRQLSPGGRRQIARQRLEQARAAMEDRGWTREQVNQKLSESTDGRIESLDQLETLASDGPSDDKGFFEGIDRVGRIAGDVATFGALDELSAGLMGLFEGVRSLAPGGRSPGEGFRQGFDRELRASRERLRKAEEGAGAGTKGVGILGGLVGPGGGIKLVSGGAKATRTGVPFARGAAAGAAEGGLFGFFGADPDPELSLGESVKERAKAAPVPAGVGAGTGGILGTIFAGRAASKAKPSAGKRLGEKARREADDLTPEPSRVRRDVKRQKRTISREQFKPLEELGEIQSDRLSQTLQSDDVKPIVRDLFPDVAEGKPPTFLQLQKIRKRIRGLKDKAVREGDSFELDKWGSALDDVTEAIGDAVEGFGPAQKAWARESARARAVEEGQKLFTKTADEVEEAFRNLPDDKAVRDAFRTGLLNKWVAKLEDLTRPVQTLRRVENSPQLRRKLSVILGSDDAVERFTREALKEGQIRSRAHLYERIKRWAGIGLATGAAGGAGGRAVTDILGF